MNSLTPTTTASGPDNVTGGADLLDVLRQHKGWSDADLDQLTRLDETINQLNQDRAALARERAEFEAEREAWNRQHGADRDSQTDGVLNKQEATETIRAEVDPFERLRKYMRTPGENATDGDDDHEAAVADEASVSAEDEASQDDQDNPYQDGETTAALTEDTEVAELQASEETGEETIEPVNDESIERRAVSRAPEATAASGDEESIEDYMAQLLSRMRGGAPAPASSAKPSQSAPPPKAEPRPQPSPTQTAPAEKSSAPVSLESANTSTPVVIRQRPRVAKTAAETLNLSAMREVANQQSRLAIDKHQRTRDGQTALGRWSLAAISGVAGVLALSASREPLPLGAALIGFTAAAYWMIQGTVATKRFFATTKTLRAASDVKQGASGATTAAIAGATVQPESKA